MYDPVSEGDKYGPKQKQAKNFVAENVETLGMRRVRNQEYRPCRKTAAPHYTKCDLVLREYARLPDWHSQSLGKMQAT